VPADEPHANPPEPHKRKDGRDKAPADCHDQAMDHSDRLRSFLDLIEDSLHEPTLRGADVARRAYLSRYHFDRLVAAAIGEPPGAFRRRLLLERAAYRLATAADRVIDVGAEAGYGSPDAFTRAFARAFGCSPSDYRRRPARRPELPAPSGIHFHPPGGLRLPATTRSDAMDVLTRMLDHHLWLTGEIVDRIGGLDDQALDRPIESSVEGIDAAPTLRDLADRLVGQLEMWATAVEGGGSIPTGASTPESLRARLDEAGPRFRELVVAPIRDGRADETFLDATCVPPQVFSYGGVLAHVLTFAAVRRTLAIGALETAGVADLGAGDPMQYVGGSGADASTLRRNYA
jgi:AraC-like DNA-binding protein